MSINLPFLKNRRMPRIETNPREPMLVNASADDLIDDQSMSEMFDAIEKKDVRKFRQALEALVMNAFDHGDE